MSTGANQTNVRQLAGEVNNCRDDEADGSKKKKNLLISLVRGDICVKPDVAGYLKNRFEAVTREEGEARPGNANTFGDQAQEAEALIGMVNGLQRTTREKCQGCMYKKECTAKEYLNTPD